MRWLVPVTVGGVVLAGGSHTTGPTGSLVAEACPKALVAVTVMRTIAPRSAVVSVKLVALAPMLVQVTPSVERCHW